MKSNVINTRRTVLGLAAPLLTLTLLISAPASAADWPGFLGPERDGVVKDGALLTDWPADGPRVAWSHDVGPGFGGAAIREGKAYILDREDIKSDTLRVYDLPSGKPLWTAGYDAPGRASYHGSRSTPMVTERFAFTIGPFGDIACFDLQTQKVAWRKHMDDFGAFPPKFAWSQSPLIVGDNIVIAPMAKDAGLVALKQATGEVVWKSGDIGAEGYGSPRLMTLAGKTQILHLTSTLVSGVDAQTGEVLWSYDGIPTKRGIPTPAKISGDRVFITAGYNSGSALLQIKRDGEGYTATELKRDHEHGGQVHSPLLVNKHLYVNLNTNETLRRNAHGLGCFDLNGNLLWKNDNTPDINRGAVLAVGEHLLTLGGEDGVLRLINADPTGYKERHAVKVFEVQGDRNMIWAPMAFADGYLILRSQNQLKCIDLRVEKLSTKQ